MYYYYLACIEPSVLTFYHHVFSTGKLRMIFCILINAVTAWRITTKLVNILSRTSIKKSKGHLIRALDCAIRNYTTGIATDIALLILSLPVLRKLQLKVTKKMAMTAVFSPVTLRDPSALSLQGDS